MLTRIQRRTVLAAALAGAVFAALAITAAWSRAAAGGDLPVSPSWQQGRFGPLVPGATYRASRVSPIPTIRARVAGWTGTEVVTHQSGRIRYESVALLGHGGEIDIVTGPAMTVSPAGALAAPRTRIANWNFAPYDPPSAVKHRPVAGRKAVYFDATAPPPGVWTLVGENPPELQMEHDRAFRMLALSVRGRTVVIVVQSPVSSFAAFLPVAERLLASLQFPTS